MDKHIITAIGNAVFIFSPFKNLETASIGVFLKTGSRYEDASIRGIAHFLEHLLFKGSKKYSHRAIKQEIEGRGGVLNGFTSHEITAYYAYFLQKNLELTLDILLDIIEKPLLNLQDIIKERKVVLQEIKMYNDLPSARAMMSLDELLWANHPLGQEVVGTIDTVSRITRKSLRNFQQNWYSPASMVIVCCGDFDCADVSAMIRRRLKNNPCKPRVYTDTPKSLRGQYVSVEKKELEQAHICVGFRGPSYEDKDRLAVTILSVILGANMSSRLFEEIREKRALCYDISTEARKYKDSGAFITQTGLDAEKIETTLNCIFTEFTKIKQKKIGEKELERAKDYLLGQTVMSLERPQGKMFYLAETFMNLGTIYTMEEIKGQIFEINASRLRALANDVFTFENMCVSCVGNVSDNFSQRLKNSIRDWK